MSGIALNGQGDQRLKDNEKRKLIGYRGHWYDVTTFIPYHPGGEVIEKFVGQDATCVIDSMHKYNVLENKKGGMYLLYAFQSRRKAICGTLYYRPSLVIIL